MHIDVFGLTGWYYLVYMKTFFQNQHMLLCEFIQSSQYRKRLYREFSALSSWDSFTKNNGIYLMRCQEVKTSKALQEVCYNHLEELLQKVYSKNSFSTTKM